MASYSPIANTEIDPESPITASLLARLRDNPLAIQQGDATAPENQTGSIADLAITAAKLNADVFPFSGSYDKGHILLFGFYKLQWIYFEDLAVDAEATETWSIPFETLIYFNICSINMAGLTTQERNSVVWIKDQDYNGCTMRNELSGDHSGLVNAYAVALGH